MVSQFSTLTGISGAFSFSGFTQLRVCTPQGSRKTQVRHCDALAAKAGPRTWGYSYLQAMSSDLTGHCGVAATWHIPAPLFSPSLPTTLESPSYSQKGSTTSMKEFWASKPCPTQQKLSSLSNASAHSPPTTILLKTEVVKNLLQAQPGEGPGLFSWTEEIVHRGKEVSLHLLQ